MPKEAARDVAETRERACRGFLEACGGDERAQKIYEESAGGAYGTLVNKLTSACGGGLLPRDRTASILACGAGAAGYSGRISVHEDDSVSWELTRGSEQRSGHAGSVRAAEQQLELPTDARFVVGWILGSLPPSELRAQAELDRLGAALKDLE